MRKLLILCFCSLAAGFAQAQLKLQAKKPPEEMGKLQFLVGKCYSGESEWFNDKGEPMKIERGEGAPDFNKKPFEIAPIMGGLYLEGGEGSEAVRSYFYFNDTEKEYYHLAIDFMGSTSMMAGGWDGKVSF